MSSILKNYTLSVANRTITLTDITTASLNRLESITDVTINKKLFVYDNSSYSTATVTSNVITLSDMPFAMMADTDKLRIVYTPESTDAANDDETSALFGTKTTNAAVPGATNIGVLPGVANAAAPTYTETYQVAESMDLSGNTRVTQGTLAFGEDPTNNVIATANKPVASATYSPSYFTAQLNDVDISVKATAGNFLSFTVSNKNAADRYFQIHDKATAPASGETAKLSFLVPAGGIRTEGKDFFGEGGINFATGIAVGISTVAATFTASTTTDHITNGTFV